MTPSARRTWDEVLAAIDDAREYSIREAARTLGLPEETGRRRLHAINAQVGGMLLYLVSGPEAKRPSYRMRGRALRAVVGLIDADELPARVERLEERMVAVERSSGVVKCAAPTRGSRSAA